MNKQLGRRALASVLALALALGSTPTFALADGEVLGGYPSNEGIATTPANDQETTVQDVDPDASDDVTDDESGDEEADSATTDEAPAEDEDVTTDTTENVQAPNAAAPRLLGGPRRSPAANKSTLYVSADGSDGTGDGSESSPYATIVKAYEESASGATIYLLSDIEMCKYVYIKHDVTIDGQGHTITRASGFATTSDTGRSWYNPSMFEVHPDDGALTVTFKNVTIDENFVHEGSSYKFQGTSPNTGDNLNRVQDGIISAYYAEGIKATIVLDNGTTLKNFGGMTAVRVQGGNELVMKSGSVIDNGGEKKTAVPDNSGEAGAVTTQGGTLTMEPGSKITGIRGVNAITENSGTVVVNGEITNCNSGAMIRPMGSSSLTIGKDGEIHNVTTTLCVIYGNSCAAGTVFNIDGKIHDVSCGPKRGGVWPSNSGSNITVNITENAELYNIPGQVIRSDLGATVNMSGGSIHGSGAALFIRKGASLNLTGGEIKDNTFGVLLANDGTSTARINVNAADEIVEGNTYDYFIDWNELGYENGSCMYFSEEKLAEEPMVVMGDMNPDNYAAEVSTSSNYKEITIAASNGYMYLGNASKASKNALSAEASNLDLTNERATWWCRDDKGQIDLDVAAIPNLNNEPIYALYVPVDAAGKPTGDVKCVPAQRSGDTVTVSLSTSDYESAKGYSVLLAQATPETYKVTINYLDKATNEAINDPYTANFVKDSNYDVTAQANKEFEGYALDSIYAEDKLTGTMGEDLTINVYYASTRGTIKFDTNGGSKIDDITQEIGSAVKAPANPTRPGYTFDGWEPNLPSEMPEGVTTVKAKWKKNPEPAPKPAPKPDNPTPTPRPSRPAVRPAQPTTPAPAATPAPASTTPAPAARPAEQPANTPAPQTPAPEPEAVPDEPAPLAPEASAEPETGAWALLNLIAAVAACGLSIFRVAGLRDEDSDEDNRKGLRLATLVPAIGSVVAFILTENMSLPMHLIDGWTPLMLGILVAQGVLTAFARNKDEEQQTA